MLHLETVAPNTFSLLKKLINLPSLHHFGLVGGTALSLLYGHRLSIDLDLFSTEFFENNDVIAELKETFGNRIVIEEKQPKFGIFCFIDDVKVDIVRHPHPILFPMYVIDEVRFFSTEDIIAMKVQAVLGRGSKKDFWDIATLLNHYKIADFVNYHKQKYTTQNLLITVPQAITYFSDADESEDPTSLLHQNWLGVKQIIGDRVREYLQ
jgi:predicted nucleotidyltransferase component of viral defense system